ncbi:MAG TPA: hypothetical protein VM925_07230 [Labilithrix sp.]|nr:hypothetical protein [Labilithrix sp.]
MIKTLGSIVLQSALVALAACSSVTTTDTESVGKASQALDKDGNYTDDEKQCRSDCTDYLGLPCARACGTGPGTTACIEKCIEQEDACKADCVKEATRPPSTPDGTADELAPVDTGAIPPSADSPPDTLAPSAPVLKAVMGSEPFSTKLKP